ncbi:MAG: alpha/beta hydrolase [Acutalibacteraceae bacterium]|nr:alpha/beta hydrolase [Acutalibacteraceae bacterium]
MNTVLKDISYGNHERQKTDIFIPKTVKSDSGLILFVHGGGWTEGDKSFHHKDAEYFSDLGYICASMNYRFVSDEINVFDELDDITSAINTIKNKCSEYFFDIDKIILSGASAGAHLSLLYACTKYNESPVKPVAVCAYCPPVDCSESDFLFGISSEFDEWKYDLLSKCCSYNLTKETYLNKAEQAALKRISPAEYVAGYNVPTAVFHGKNDNLIPLNHIKNFIDLLNKNGVENDLLIYENSGHTIKDDPDCDIKSKLIFKSYAEKYL